MRNISGKFWLAGSMSIVLASVVVGAMPAAQTINLPEGGAVVLQDDDDEDVVKARVARISFIRGDVKIKRIDNDEWEKAVLNLPLVEGDEITTGPDARVEVQFNNFAHVRLDGDAYLKFAVLKDQGVAMSLTQGTLGLRVTELDKAGGYFEIDAPKTTIAIEKSGSYRVDAGRAGDAEMNVSVRDGGSARVYSDSAGFTLKSGRTARVFIDGENVGEWETSAYRADDDFDTWASDRDSVIAKRIRSAHYDKYYDQDIYGAEDLNHNGEWIYTSSYGYVWRPHSSALSGYADWSPYRYGHWRWVQPFGWTWINDEPWGWATYHHGRWIYDRGYWVWAPYGYHRPRRSWWFPALVVINVFNNNVCWYPLGYRRRWRNYNHHAGNNGGGQIPPVIGTGRVTKPKGTVLNGPRGKDDEIPGTGIISLPTDKFGTKVRAKTVTPINAKRILEEGPDNPPPLLPDRRTVDIKNSPDIIAVKPRLEPIARQTMTGAAPRKMDAPLDQELRTKRIYGDRQKIETPIVAPTESKGTRPIGAVDRPKRPVDVPTEVKPQGSLDTKPVRQPRIDPVERKSPPSRSEPPVKQPSPKYDPPVYTPPVRSEPAPRRETPPAPKSDPPQKSEPKPVERPTVRESKENPKDGR